MSTFKDKPLKKCHTDNRKMIDDIHHDLVHNMTEEEKTEYLNEFEIIQVENIMEVIKLSLVDSKLEFNNIDYEN